MAQLHQHADANAQRGAAQQRVHERRLLLWHVITVPGRRRTFAVALRAQNGRQRGRGKAGGRSSAVTVRPCCLHNAGVMHATLRPARVHSVLPCPALPCVVHRCVAARTDATAAGAPLPRPCPWAVAQATPKKDAHLGLLARRAAGRPRQQSAPANQQPCAAMPSCDCCCWRAGARGGARAQQQGLRNVLKPCRRLVRRCCA